MRPVQPSVVAARHHVMLSTVPSSGRVNIMIRITGIGDRDRPEWLIRINGIRSYPGNGGTYQGGNPRDDGEKDEYADDHCSTFVRYAPVGAVLLGWFKPSWFMQDGVGVAVSTSSGP